MRVQMHYYRRIEFPKEQEIDLLRLEEQQLLKDLRYSYFAGILAVALAVLLGMVTTRWYSGLPMLGTLLYAAGTGYTTYARLRYLRKLVQDRDRR